MTFLAALSREHVVFQLFPRRRFAAVWLLISLSPTEYFQCFKFERAYPIFVKLLHARRLGSHLATHYASPYL